MRISPEEFQDKLHAAAVCHNMGVIHRRTSKTYEAIQSFEDSLDLYNECVVSYNYLSESISRNHDNYHHPQNHNFPNRYQHHQNQNDNTIMDKCPGTPNSVKSKNSSNYCTSSIPICLELKVAQTLQSMARLYFKSLHDTDSAIKAHEDAIHFLVHGKFVMDDADDDNNSHCGDGYQYRGSSINIVYDSPQRQERISKHHHNHDLCDEYNNFISPTSTMISHDDKNVSFHFDNLEDYNIVKMTEHERMRVISTSLNGLAGIYASLEMEAYERRQKRLNRTSDELVDDDDEDDDESENCLEDPLQYYQQGLVYLRQLPELASETLIPALSNDNKTITTANDAALTITKLASPMIIDLRKDISGTLMQMGALFMQRQQFEFAVEAFEEARDVRLELCTGDETLDDDYIESLYSLGLSYQKLGSFKKAMPCFQVVLKMKKQSCGPESIECANLYCNMSNILRLTGNIEESLSFIKRAIVVYKRNKECYEEKDENNDDQCNDEGSNHHLTVCKCVMGALKNCASLYMQMEEVPMAIESYLEIMEIQKQIGLDDHPDFATTMNILGDLYFTNNELEKAKSAFALSLGMYREFGLGENDPDFIMALNSIVEIEESIESRREKSKADEPKETKEVKSICKSPKKQTTRPVQQIGREESLKSGFEIYTNSDADDLVSTITFTAKKKASDYVYEGVLGMSKAMENVATVAEEFFSGTGVPISSMQSENKDFISPSGFEYVDENVEQILGTNKDVLKNDAQVKGDDLSALLGSYSSEDFAHQSREDYGKNLSNTSNKNDVNSTSIIDSRKQKPSDTSSIQGDASTLFGTAFVNNGSVVGENSEIRTRSVATSILDDNSSLIGTSFVKGGSIRGDNSRIKTPSIVSSVQDDVSTLIGVNFLNNESVHSKSNRNIHDKQHTKMTNIQPAALVNESYANIDDLMAQMNVVTNDDEGNAKPFKDVLQIESSEFDSSPDFSVNKRKNFEKLSNCLDTLEELEEKYGSGHVKSLDTLQTLADIYFNNGEKTKGINTLMKVASVQKKKYGQNHVEVINTYRIIAKLWIEMKEYPKAIESYTRVKEIEEFLYGNTDHRIALTLNKIGEIELGRGDFDLAMDRFQEALRIQRIYLAPNEINPDISQTLVNIGSVYYKERNSFKKIKLGDDTYKSFIESGMLGKIAFAHSERGEYVKATHFYEELLQLLKNRGQFDRGIVSTLNYLGVLSVKLGRYVEAMSYHSDALEIIEKLENATDLEICEGKINIGIVEYKSGNFPKAIQIIESETKKMKNLIGEGHYRVAKSEYHLGVIRRILCQYDKALSLFESAHVIQLQFLQKHHPDTMSTQLEIGITKLELYQIDEAKEHFNSLLQNQLDVLGKVHPDLALSYHYIGACHARKGEMKMASKNLRRSFRMCQELQSESSEVTRLLETPEVAKLLEEIGYIHLSKQKYERAAIVFHDSLQLRRDCFGEDHFEVAYGLINLGVLFTEKLEFNQAMSCFNEAMSIGVRTFGLHHPLIADVHLNVGKVQQRKCHFDEAKKEISLAIKIYMLSLSSSHEKVISATKSLERVDHEEELCV